MLFISRNVPTPENVDCKIITRSAFGECKVSQRSTSEAYPPSNSKFMTRHLNTIVCERSVIQSLVGKRAFPSEGNELQFNVTTVVQYQNPSISISATFLTN